MTPRYRVVLTPEDRTLLEGLTKDGNTPVKRFLYARMLLLCDTGGGTEWAVGDIAEALGVTSRTVEHLKKRFVEKGLNAALERKVPEKPRTVRFDGHFELRLKALACSDPPEGRKRWTVKLLAAKVVELRITESVSHMTVCNTLKKMNVDLSERSRAPKRVGGMTAAADS